MEETAQESSGCSGNICFRRTASFAASWTWCRPSRCLQSCVKSPEAGSFSPACESTCDAVSCLTSKKSVVAIGIFELAQTCIQVKGKKEPTTIYEAVTKARNNQLSSTVQLLFKREGARDVSGSCVWSLAPVLTAFSEHL